MNETVQPTRRKTKRAEDQDMNRFDQTSLSAPANGEGQVHRDYIAHAFRWGFACRRFVVQDESKVLDVGCGPLRPLQDVMLFGYSARPAIYVGCDLNDIKPTGYSRAHLYPHFNFIERYQELIDTHGQFDLVTNLEVIEHMPLEMGMKLLEAMHACTKPNGTLLLSTPVFNGHRAVNHVHEYTVEQLRYCLEKTGWLVTERYGTFMSKTEWRHVKPEHQAIADELCRYYSQEVMSTFLAPLYPDLSRNNLWVCLK